MYRVTVMVLLACALALAGIPEAKILPCARPANADVARVRPGPARPQDDWVYSLEWKFSTNNILCVGLTPVQDTLIWVSSAGHTTNTDPNWMFIFDARTHALLDSFEQQTSTDWGYRDMCYDPAEDVVYAGTDNNQLDKLDATDHTVIASYTVSGSNPPGVVRALAFDGDSLYSANFTDVGVVKFATDGTNAHEVAGVPPYAAYGIAIAQSYGKAYMTSADETGMVLQYDYPAWTISDSMYVPELGDVHGGCEMWLNDTFLLVLGQNEPMDSVICLRVVPPAKDVGTQAIIEPNGIISPNPVTPLARVRNYGTQAQGPFDVKLTITPGGYSSTKSVSSLAPNDTVRVSFDQWTPAGAGIFQVKCTTMLAGDEIPDNDAKQAAALIVNFSQDFEATNGGFTSTGRPDPNWQWGMPESPRPPAHSGNNAWGAALAGQYPNTADWRLNSVSFVAVQDTPVLAFYHWILTERRYDGGNLKLSTDGGANWTLLYPWEPYSRRYDTIIASTNAGIPDEWGYSGSDVGEWDLALFQLPVDSGTGFQLRWHFGTDISILNSGWLIDDVAGIGFTGVAKDVGPEAIVEPAGIIAPGTHTPRARVRNFGTQAQGPFDVKLTITPGGYSSIRTVGSVAPYDTALVTFDDWAPAESGMFTVRCTTLLSGDEVENNNTRLGMCAIPNFTLDFEASNGEYSAENSPSPGWDWGVPESPRPPAHSGTNAWSAPLSGNYVSDADWRLHSVAYTAYQDTPVVVFWHWYDFERGYDGGNVKYSADGGSSWTVLAPWTLMCADYDDDEMDDGNIAIPFEPGYTGRDTTWRQAWFQVPVANGSEFLLRWHFGTDGSVTSYYGWIVDDVSGLGCGAAAGIAAPEPRFVNRLAVTPNPCPGRAQVNYSLARPGTATLRLYDISGQLVRTVTFGPVPAGNYVLNLEARDLARGIYLVRFDSPGFSATRKLVIE